MTATTSCRPSACASAVSARWADARRAVAELRKMVADFLAHAVEEDPSLPTPEDMGSHEAPELEFADDGPVLEVGASRTPSITTGGVGGEEESHRRGGDGRRVAGYRCTTRGRSGGTRSARLKAAPPARPAPCRRCRARGKRRHAAEAAHASSSTEPEGTADDGAAPRARGIGGGVRTGAAASTGGAGRRRRPPRWRRRRCLGRVTPCRRPRVLLRSCRRRAPRRWPAAMASRWQASERPSPGERAVASAGPAEPPPPPPSTRPSRRTRRGQLGTAAVAATVLEGQRVIAIDVRCIWCEAKVSTSHACHWCRRETGR